MSNEKMGSLGLSEEELIERLIENRDSNGYFTVTADETDVQEPDENVSKELRLFYAIEKFENSLEHKPEGKSVIELVL